MVMFSHRHHSVDTRCLELEENCKNFFQDTQVRWLPVAIIVSNTAHSSSGSKPIS